MFRDRRGPPPEDQDQAVPARPHELVRHELLAGELGEVKEQARGPELVGAHLEPPRRLAEAEPERKVDRAEAMVGHFVERFADKST